MALKLSSLNILMVLSVVLTSALFGQGQNFQQAANIDGRGFSISPPPGWEVSKNINGASLLFQAPKVDSDEYRRNIRIMTFSGSQYIDEVSLETYAKEIQEKSTKMSNTVQNYRIRDLTLIELGEGVPAGLFYADFQLNGLPMMQMRVLVSSAKYHFLLTYTDVQKNFEDTSNGYLDQAYQTFQTVNLDSLAPGRNDFLIQIGIGATSLILFFSGFSIYRKYRIKQLGAGIDEYDDDEDDDSKEMTDEPYAGLDDDDQPISDGFAVAEEKKQSKKTGLFKSKSVESEDEDSFDDEEVIENPKEQSLENEGTDDEWKLA